jgi:hypothetical protein
MDEADAAAALAFLDEQLSKLEEEQEEEENKQADTLPPDPDGASQRHDEILRQAASVHQTIQDSGQNPPDAEEIDLENLDLEWRFSTPSTRF